jgi:hypothetical protein
LRRTARWTVVGAAALAALLLGTIVFVRWPAGRATFRLPSTLPVLGQAADVYDGDIGDPFVLRVPGTHRSVEYVMLGTNDEPTHVPTAHSDDLRHWVRGPDALPTLPRWASPDPEASLTWAPAALAVDGRYLLYVSVQDARSQRECIAAETSMTPDGPYADTSSGPLVCQRELGGSIDPSLTRDRAGQLHLLWKSDGNCCGLPASIWEEQLTPDGLGLVGWPHRLLTADQRWQGGIIEEPAMTPASSGGWWLFYSGNRFDSVSYAEGLAYCAKLEGPCRETQNGPFLSIHGYQLSPGGLDTFTADGGALWVAV